MAASLDEDDLARRVTAAAQWWREGAAVNRLRPLAGGASGLTYDVVLSVPGAPDVRAVVKVAPPGLAPVRNRDVLRQARLARALHGVPGMAVARPLFEDRGDPGPSDRPPLFVSEFVGGESFEPIIDERDGPLPPPQVIEGRARATVAVLAALHSVDPAAVGLGDEPVLSLADELDRWSASFETVTEELRPRWEELRAALVGSLPSSLSAAIVHGDFRLGNTLCEDTEVRAVIDWEIWSLTDPRVDLAWLSMFCRRREQPTAVREAPGMPDVATLRSLYEERVSYRVENVPWFDAFVRFKQAATIALIVKRRRRAATERGQDPGPVSETPRRLIARGLELIEEADRA